MTKPDFSIDDFGRFLSDLNKFENSLRKKNFQDSDEALLKFLAEYAVSSNLDVEKTDNAKSANNVDSSKAVKELFEKKSSYGIKYSDAKAKTKEIKDKYQNNPNCQSQFPLPIDENGYVTFEVTNFVEGFDPYRLPVRVKTEYFNALNAMIEIEENNKDLFEQTKFYPTSLPLRPQDYKFY